MDGILTKQRIHVAAEQDRVHLNVGRLQVQIPYASAFKIAQGLRLAAKDAMRYSGVPAAEWRKHAALNEMPERTVPYRVSEKRRITVSGQFQWRAGYEGEDVKIQFGNQLLKFHFVIALKISEWLRAAGKESRAWAGDGSRMRIATGVLSNAEENYRLGVK